MKRLYKLGPVPRLTIAPTVWATVADVVLDRIDSVRRRVAWVRRLALLRCRPSGHTEI